MQQSLRSQYNSQFDAARYAAYTDELKHKFPDALQFRVAETPIFVPRAFKQQLLDACEAIVDVIVRPDFKELTRNAIPAGETVPGENGHSHFICFDFGICENEAGELEPQLIEMQGFPSLFAYEAYMPIVSDKYFPTPPGYSPYLGGFEFDSYIALLRNIILGNHAPENVVLLEIKPHEQKTRIDFYCTQEYLGIPIVCLTELIQEGTHLFYNRDGVKTPIHRIYNRVIFDELKQQLPHLGPVVDITQPLDVEWAPHPNWFYRISKYTLPFIRHPYVPATYFLNELTQVPADLENYVLKPLFSFAGQGVVIDVTTADVEAVQDPHNWILQRKVKYSDVIATPDGPAKAEIRIFYFWEDGQPRPVPANNLARLSKGKMIGVRYNKDKEWVGGSFCLFEEG
jgi:hypothetical protein